MSLKAMHYAILAAFGLAALLSAQGPTVTSSTPARHAVMGPFDPIKVNFAAPIAPATVTAHSFSVFGRWMGAVPGAISVDAAGQAITFQPLRPMFVGDVVQVSLARTITAAGGAAMVGGHHFQVTVGSAPGSGVFLATQTIPFRLPAEGPISTYGIHAGDVDRDGSPDITAVNELGHDIRVFKNNGCSNYGQMTQVPDGQNWPSPQESADFNRDGWIDLATGDWAFGNVSVFFNNGQGNYLTPITLSGGSYIRSLCVGDLDGDGFPDIVAGNGTNTLVWINNGSGGFLAPVSYAQGGYELNVVDADEDGHLDVVGSDPSATCVVLVGNGNGTFSPNATMTGIGAWPFQSNVADLNGDGHIDIGFVCQSPDSYRWLFGNGTGNFTFGGSMPAGGWPTSIHMADLEADGDVDVVLSHYSSADFYIYFNNGTGGFANPVILPAVGGASCTTIADFDRDGDLDIMGADEIADVGILFSQTGPSVPGVQQAACDSTVRINQRADGAGFGSSAPVPVRVGAQMALSLSGPPNGLAVLVIGFPSPVSFPLFQWGLLSLDITLPTVILWGGLFDPHGESMMPYSFPITAPTGIPLAVQGLVFLTGSELLSNPMSFVLVP